MSNREIRRFHEYYHGLTGLSIGIRDHLFSRKTPYQQVDIFDTDTWGRLLVIDGMIMLSEKDEFVYHEMISHVGLFTHSSPEDVLIIGGGDGGTAREVLKHPNVQRVDLVEIDEVVVEASRTFLPEVGSFGDSRLRICIDDGVRFTEQRYGEYDVIIIDGSDPTGPAEALFSPRFFDACRTALREDGVLTAQMESPWVDSYHSAIRDSFWQIESGFTHTGLYLCSIPLYPAGLWAMICASQHSRPDSEVVLNRSEQGVKRIDRLQYYTPDIHRAAFVLPPFVRRILNDREYTG